MPSNPGSQQTELFLPTQSTEVLSMATAVPQTPEASTATPEIQVTYRERLGFSHEALVELATMVDWEDRAKRANNNKVKLENAGAGPKDKFLKDYKADLTEAEAKAAIAETNAIANIAWAAGVPVNKIDLDGKKSKVVVEEELIEQLRTSVDDFKEEHHDVYYGKSAATVRKELQTGRVIVKLPKIITVGDDLSDKDKALETEPTPTVKVNLAAAPRAPKISGKKIDVINSDNLEALGTAARLLQEYLTARVAYNQLNNSGFDYEEYVKMMTLIDPTFANKLPEFVAAADATLTDYLGLLAYRDRKNGTEEVYQFAKRSALGAIAIREARALIPADVIGETDEQTFNELDMQFGVPNGDVNAKQRYRNALGRVTELYEWKQAYLESVGLK